MKESTLLRFFIVSAIISVGLGFASFYTLRALNESSTSEVRKHMIEFSVQIVEGAPYTESVQARHFHPGKLSFGSDLWVLSENGEILATNTSSPLPISWSNIKKPVAIHNFTFHYRPFRLVSDLTLVKLDSKENTYLLIGSKRHPSLSGPFWVQISFLIFVSGLAILIALIIITFYLKKKSLEARTVLARLEKGDLKARFEIKKVDEIGSLMLDFNRMASEIERLVHQVQQTEKARKNLLEELSHDIRTPLTTLKTSIETLSDHLDEMPKEQQRDFLKVSRTELTYFLHLIEDLFFIADLGEPRYKKTTEEIDLTALVTDEVGVRRSHNHLQWKFEYPELTGKPVILGDPILIQRLLKNSFDNAAKFAASKVTLRIESGQNAIHIIIEDDGIGISDEAVTLFGQRKKQRFQFTDKPDTISLGLGSVIMRTIVELHGGDLIIERIADPQGTRLTLKLPKRLFEGEK